MGAGDGVIIAAAHAAEAGINTVMIVGISIMLFSLVFEFFLGIAEVVFDGSGDIFFGPGLFVMLGLFLTGVIVLCIGGFVA